MTAYVAPSYPEGAIPNVPPGLLVFRNHVQQYKDAILPEAKLHRDTSITLIGNIVAHLYVLGRLAKHPDVGEDIRSEIENAHPNRKARYAAKVTRWGLSLLKFEGNFFIGPLNNLIVSSLDEVMECYRPDFDPEP